MLGKIIARLREPSSLAGLMGLAVLSGHAGVAQELANAAGLVLGLLAVLVPEGAGDA